LSLRLRQRTIFKASEFDRHHYYSIKYNGENLDILCPGYKLANGPYVVVIPWYLIPGRPYPLQVYQFACSYYSANPESGQRGAAEATREKFNLKTFSHSTVGRSFSSFEESRKAALGSRFGEEAGNSGTEGLIMVSAALKPIIEDDEEARPERRKKPHSARRFPSVSDTAERREAMSGFLPKFPNGAKTADIEAAGGQFAKSWHEETRRLLL